MKRKDYYKQLHKKEVKVFNVIVKKVVKGLLMITSCMFEKMEVGNGYRFIVYFRDAE